MLQHAQNTCLQVFRTHRVHHIACCNRLKTPACRHSGHIEYFISCVATCSKHLPAGLSDSSCNLYRMLHHAQNTCLQVFRTHRVPHIARCNRLKTPAGRFIGKVDRCRRSKTILKTDGNLTPSKSVTHFLQQLHTFDHGQKKKRKSFGFSEIPPLLARLALTPNGMGLTFWVPETWSWRCFW